MPEYNVIVSQQGTRTSTVVVEASSPQEAIEQCRQGNANNPAWHNWGPWAVDEGERLGFSAIEVSTEHQQPPVLQVVGEGEDSLEQQVANAAAEVFGKAEEEDA